MTLAIATRPSAFTRAHTNTSLHSAVVAIASVCDGAHENDHTGFNSLDALFGARVAQHTTGPDWSEEMSTEVHRMLRKYTKQLAGFGIDYDSLPEPIVVSEDTAALTVARDEARAFERASKRGIKVYLDCGAFLVKGQGTYEVKDVIKAFGARWDSASKAWSFSTGQAGAVLALVQTVDWLAIDDSAEESLTGVIAAAPAGPVVVKAAKVIKGRVAIVWRNIPESDWDILIKGVRTLPGRVWSATAKANICDLSRETLTFLRTHGFDGADDVESALITFEEEAQERLGRETEAEAASHASETDRVVALAASLYAYQQAGVAYIVDHAHGQAILGDEMGLGKTRQAIAVIEDTESYPAVIVCPPHLTRSWLAEIHTVNPTRKAVILKGTKPNPAAIAGADILIVGYSVLTEWVNARVGDPETGEALLQPKAVVFDESHFAKNSKSQRTKAALVLARRVREGGIRLCLTGTPVLNRVEEILTQIELIGRWTEFGSKAEFLRKYQSASAFELAELNTRLRRTCYVRRLKKDVLLDLPAKSRANALVEADARHRRQYFTAAQDIIAYLVALKGAKKADVAAKAAALVRLNTLRQIAGSAKIEGAVEWASSFVAETERSLVVFASHKDVQNGIYDGLKAQGITVARIHGSDSDAVVDAEKARFMSGDARVIVCSLKKGGTGHTLTAASDVLIVEQDWTPANLNQAEDRVHRIGQDADAVTATHLVVDLSIDEHLRGIVARKQVVCDAVSQGGEVDDTVEESVLNEVINALLKDAGK